MINEALVLAAGMGSRIRPVAGDRPKPLLSFGGAPILAHNLRWLAASGVNRIWINLHFAAQAIRSEIGDGSAFGVDIRYVYEPALLGTAGALGNIASELTDRVWVVYGDNIVRFDLAAMAQAHQQARAELTLALFDRARHIHTGIAGGRVALAADGGISAFVEGGQQDAISTLVNAGVYLSESTIVDLIAPNRLVDFGRDVFPAMLARDRKLNGHVIEEAGFCLGLDTPESYVAGQRLLDDKRLVLS